MICSIMLIDETLSYLVSWTSYGGQNQNGLTKEQVRVDLGTR